MKRSRLLMVTVGIMLLGAAGWWGWHARREKPSVKVPRLLREFAEVPSGKFEPFYFGRSQAAIDADWRSLGPESVPALIAALNDPRLSRRYLVAERLAEIGDPRAVPALLAALDDYDFIVRMWAVHALRDLRDPRAIEPLIACLEDKESCVRSAAAKALGGFGDKRAVPPLIQCLERHEHEDWWTRVEAAKALGNLGDTRAIEPIRTVRKWDKTDSIREEGAKALRKLGVVQADDP